MSTSLTPNLMTENVNETIQFYCDRLGFQFQMGLPLNTEKPVREFSADIPLQFAMINRNGTMLMLQSRASLAKDCERFSNVPVAASATFYLEMDDLESVMAKLDDDVQTVVPERTTFYGMRELWILDNNGYVITLAQKVA
jgi:uncharacterized glyoxalase superfamily protein PhnB